MRERDMSRLNERRTRTDKKGESWTDKNGKSTISNIVFHEQQGVSLQNSELIQNLHLESARRIFLSTLDRSASPQPWTNLVFYFKTEQFHCAVVAAMLAAEVSYTTATPLNCSYSIRVLQSNYNLAIRLLKNQLNDCPRAAKLRKRCDECLLELYKMLPQLEFADHVRPTAPQGLFGKKTALQRQPPKNHDLLPQPRSVFNKLGPT